MFLHFACVNIQTGEFEIPSYVDVTEIVSWNRWKVPDDQAGGIHRGLRGKLIIVLNMKSGIAHWTDESFDSVSARILEARGQDAATAARLMKDRAELHAAAYAAEQMSAKKSSLAV
jgi:hypothetical protein